MALFSQELYAGDTFTYSANISLSNSMTWIANGILATLDLLDVFDSNNTEVGVLSANLALINSNTPNSINYHIILTATANQTSNWIANSVNPTERVLYLFPKYTSNTGIIQHGNAIIVKVRATVNS